MQTLRKRRLVLVKSALAKNQVTRPSELEPRCVCENTTMHSYDLLGIFCLESQPFPEFMLQLSSQYHELLTLCRSYYYETSRKHCDAMLTFGALTWSCSTTKALLGLLDKYGSAKCMVGGQCTTFNEH
jgi:hypothetical protein